MEVALLMLDTQEDRIHLRVRVDPTMSIHQVVKQIKRESSVQLRKEFKELTTKLPTLWDNNYYVATIGTADICAIEDFVREQPTSQRQKIKYKS